MPRHEYIRVPPSSCFLGVALMPSLCPEPSSPGSHILSGYTKEELWQRPRNTQFRIATRALHTSIYSKIFDAGGDLLSHTLPGAVPSAQTGLASGFGKGPGVTPSQKPPTNTYRKHTPTPPQQDDWCAVSSQTLHSRRENLQSICATHAHHTTQRA